jgi:hypothetical protein
MTAYGPTSQLGSSFAFGSMIAVEWIIENAGVKAARFWSARGLPPLSIGALTR